MPEATAFLIESPSASASGIETTRPSGCEATAASMICAICTMSKVSGALILDGDAEVLGGLVDAVLDHRPERVRGLAVADHDEAHVLGQRRAGEAERAGEDDGLCQSRCHDCLPPWLILLLP